MKSGMLCIVLALAAASASFAGVEDDIKALDLQWAAAAKSADAAKLEKLFANDIVYTHSSGVQDTKTSYIEKVKSKRQVYEGIDHSNIKVTVYNGNTAVLTARMHMFGTNQSGKFDDQLLLTHVWVKVKGAWQLAAHQTTNVAK